MEDDTEEDKLLDFYKSRWSVFTSVDVAQGLKAGDLKFGDETARQPRNALSF
jgi:hypothetical protein